MLENAKNIISYFFDLFKSLISDPFICLLIIVFSVFVIWAMFKLIITLVKN